MSNFTYAKDLYQSKRLRKIIPLYIKKILEASEATGSTVLVSRGSSGCSIAAACLMSAKLSKFSHIHVTKGTSHSGRISGSPDNGEEKKGFLFVDDFIDSGETFLSVQDTLANVFKISRHGGIVGAIVLDQASYKKEIVPKEARFFIDQTEIPKRKGLT